MEIGLVSCTKSKRSEAARPQDLYDPSALFRKASSYAEEHHDDWYILSAKHGLLDPDGDAIDPYDETLTTRGIAERRTWSERVCQQLVNEGLLKPEGTLVFHAGKAYYDELVPLLADSPVEIEIPTEGLQLGETLAWYTDRQ